MSSDLIQKLSTVIRINPDLPVRFIGPSVHTDHHGSIEYNTPDVLLDVKSVEVVWFYDNRSTHTLITPEGRMFTSCEGGILTGNSKEDVIEEMVFDEDDERIEEIIQVLLITLQTNIQ